MKRNYWKQNILFTLLLSLVFGAHLLGQEKQFTVVIDVGHGGTDNGAVVDNYNEKQIVLDIAKMVKEMSSNVNVVLTRENDETFSLKERANRINELEPELAISIHANNGNEEQAKGFDIFVGRELSNPTTQKLADLLYENFKSITQLNDRGEAREAGFTLLRTSKVPIVILEVGFMSNKKDLKYITSKNGRQEIASAIVKTLEQMKSYM